MVNENPALNTWQQAYRVTAGVSAAVAVALGVLGSLLTNEPGLRPAHSGLAMLFIVTSLLATLAALKYSKASGVKGVGHACGVFVLSIMQYALGELSVTMVHMLLGFLILLGAVTLFMLSMRGARPAGGTPSDANPAT